MLSVSRHVRPRPHNGCAEKIYDGIKLNINAKSSANSDAIKQRVIDEIVLIFRVSRGLFIIRVLSLKICVD